MKYFIIPYAVTVLLETESTIDAVITWKCEQYPNLNSVESYIRSYIAKQFEEKNLNAIEARVTGAPVPISKQNYEEWIR